jgi:hypothetical protein
MIMSRSLQFQGYDSLLQLNFYHNRHVRIFLSLAQMAWDPVEGSGVLAAPITESIPPVLLQAGLGDPIVSTFAAETLARAFGAVIVLHNPRSVFGVPAVDSGDILVNASFIELEYDLEYLGLPADNVFAQPNNVHYCTRMDDALIRQLSNFLNTGVVIDPCIKDGCHRGSPKCW